MLLQKRRLRIWQSNTEEMRFVLILLFLENQNKGKVVNMWFVLVPILSIYHHYFYWLVIQSKFHSFFCYKRFSFSKSNLKYMTKILIDIQLAILKKTRLINLAADLCFEFIICDPLLSQACYYLL